MKRVIAVWCLAAMVCLGVVSATEIGYGFEGCPGFFSGSKSGPGLIAARSDARGSGQKAYVSASEAFCTRVSRQALSAQEWKEWKAWKEENGLAGVSYSDYKDYTANYADTLTFDEYQEYKEFITEYTADGAAPAQKGFVAPGGEEKLVVSSSGDGGRSFALRSEGQRYSSEALTTAGKWGSGNLIMNVTDGLDEYAKLRFSNFIRPFHEAGLAAMTPQQPFHQFLAAAKAGKLSVAEMQEWANTFKANQDAYLGAFEAAFNTWAEPYKSQGFMLGSGWGLE